MSPRNQQKDHGGGGGNSHNMLEVDIIVTIVQRFVYLRFRFL